MRYLDPEHFMNLQDGMTAWSKATYYDQSLASYYGDEVVRILLGFPGIDVNSLDKVIFCGPSWYLHR
jgi:hypothetical protein